MSNLETGLVFEAVTHLASGAEACPPCPELVKQFETSLIELAFPFRALSLVIAADRRSTDPIYGVHRWWARRPPALMRALLLGSFLKASVTEEEFWDLYRNPGHPILGMQVLDPFMGGGSTLVEAARLGATVRGGDVDPLAVRIVRYELAPADSNDVLEASESLVAFLQSKVELLFYPRSQSNEPLHYFYIAEVTCSACGNIAPLYRNLILVRDLKRKGAVVRNHPITAFCPTNYCIHKLDDLNQTELKCCGKIHKIYSGTFSGARFRCPHCATASPHRELCTGIAPRRLIGIEETIKGKLREIRPPDHIDLAAISLAEHEWSILKEVLPHPATKIPAHRRDQRPISYGIQYFDQLFTHRQLIVFGHAFNWLQDMGLPERIDCALRLALSNALATNNRLCGYATDYGRLASLFTIRGYSVPALPVELNPLHLTAGRGTIMACMHRVAQAGTGKARRYVWSAKEQRALPQLLAFETTKENSSVEARSADSLPPESLYSRFDACIFDPPYFDYIAYDELSEFHRAWMKESALVGKPLLPNTPATPESFGLRFAACLKMILLQLRPGRPLAFTYHSAKREAWSAIGVALDGAGLSVTGIWPVRSDGHMGHHSHEGNCEWDIVVICRRSDETQPSRLQQTLDSWTEILTPLKVSGIDRLNIELALDMASTRFASVNGRDDQ